ncbi:gliding motility-associated C-terminal domain-containing protein [Chryseolinea lacunae]|uniref:Gliding motility-associated C-terminal domain-containing protein n=1 Tax=Chryseolinea lacunae TaxID=2801331 RepID=A0ABS1KW73_9BACT|nr:gliding motility-associated C-terminal domain-containing protein [Chryseolinea lacunae]MBL0743714.1 gliding motility-associated C-terminal domain-containing protein [Chryseolinea lacunae]
MFTIRRFLFCFACLLCSLACVAQCNDWEKLIYYKNAQIDDVARDPFDNTYVAGSYYIDDFTIGPYTFPVSTDGNGAFIAKFDKNFSLVWAKNPTAPHIYASEIEVDAQHNIVVAGTFYGGPATFDCITIPNTGRSDIFVVNYSSDGVPLWATSSTGADDEGPSGLTISPNGNIILASTFVERSGVTPGLGSPDVTMGGVPVITGSAVQIEGGYDSFIAAIRPNGTVAWTQGVGGDGNAYDYILDVKTDSQNNIVFTGYFNSPEISVDGLVVHSFTISENFFLMKLDADGDALWVRESEGGVDQGGYGVAVDGDDNIFVSGRFYDAGTRFGPISISGAGGADVFVAKIDPDGNPIAARSFGDTAFDAGTQVEVDSEGRVLLAAYYYSSVLTIGPYTSTKLGTASDSFIATLSNDLTTVECARFVTGTSDAIFWNIELDRGDNVWAMVFMPIPGGTTTIGTTDITDDEVSMVIASLGINPSPDAGGSTPPTPPTNIVSLGADVTLCPGEKVVLTPGARCNAQFVWSTGSNNNTIEVSEPGKYWVDVTWQGNTVRAEIEIFRRAPMAFSLGNDQLICPGSAVSWNLPYFADATYQWNDGSTATTKTVSTAGSYWVKVSNACQTLIDTATVSIKPTPVVDLGDDIALCAGKDVVLQYAVAPGETIQWSDGNTSAAMTVTGEGVYGISVSNGCTTKTDVVKVTLKPLPVVDLGDDQKLCDGKAVQLAYTAKPGETVQWSDGSAQATLPIEQPGTYGVAVTNACGTTQDDVLVTIKDPGDIIIPNVITPNGDKKNDYFLLPDNVQDASLAIYNRWGERVFATSVYENNWPQTTLSTGIYFYALHGKCIPDQKGMIHLIH